ncbi:MAG: hypothetical protein AMXMBFR84_21320 [Candidatus Hydrogenedentota bacterium]
MIRHIVLIVCFFPALGCDLVLGHWDRQALPMVKGSLRVPGIHGEVEVLRDGHGVPHIYAGSQRDLFFAQGFVQAQDRFWQMDLFRRYGRGTIGELVGRREEIVTQDIYYRTIGLYRSAEEEVRLLDADTRAMFEAFAEGVNAYLRGKLPCDLSAEYSALSAIGLRYKIDPWTPADSLVWGKVVAELLSSPSYDEGSMAQVQAAISPEMFAEWLPPFPDGVKPTIVLPEDLPSAKAGMGRRSQNYADSAAVTRILPDRSRWWFQRGDGMGSNNWMVSGERTASGRPLFANDPHLAPTMIPGLFYEVGLHCSNATEPMHLAGFALATSPGVFIGHNEYMAWGFTASGADVHDTYRITVNPANPLEYWWDGSWRPFRVREETIRFADGSPPLVVQVRETHFGPIVNELHVTPNATGTAFNNVAPHAIRYTVLEPGRPATALKRLYSAKNWVEFGEATALWDYPAINIGYADIHGNIGYRLLGKIPIRAGHHSGLTPVSGSDSAMQWLGFIPFDHLPKVLNPQGGLIVSANQVPAPQSYFDGLADQLGAGPNYHFVPVDNFGYRGGRIMDLLKANTAHTPDSLRAIQSDVVLPGVEEVIPYLREIDMGSPELNTARDWFVGWDGEYTLETSQGLLYPYFLTALFHGIYDDQAGDWPPLVEIGYWSVYLLLADPGNVWWDDTATEPVETRDDILRRSFAQGLAGAASWYGPDRGAWRWGDRHYIRFTHIPLGYVGVAPVEDFFNRGPHEIRGTSGTINMASWSFVDGSFEANFIPVIRLICDVGNWDNTRALNCTGQSGHPGSPHYGDQIQDWIDVNLHIQPWNRRAVEAASVNRLVLHP